MEVSRVEVDRITFIENYLLVLKYNSNSALEYKVELLAGMLYQLCRLIRRLKCNKERLHYLIGITESKILEAIALISADASALAPADNMKCIYTAGFAGNELIKIDAEFICDLIDDAYGKISVFLISSILLHRYSQFLSKLFLCMIANFPQFTDPCSDLINSLHNVTSLIIGT